ncbi:MAG: hypothetical protein HKN78_03475 [Sphingomonadaceae bacterium]|nr:hypothetical protein [Sphingomonadaceae bacterium]
MRISKIALFAVPALAAAALALPSISSAEDELERWQTARAIGESESCISIRQIRRTEVHDNRTIDFHMTGRRIYRNTLPSDCGSLGFEEAFSYETSLSRLCSSDIITVLQQPISQSIPGPRCGLGRFQPIEFPES